MSIVLASPASIESVALVTDVTGKVVVRGATTAGALAILSEIAPDERVHLEGGSRLAVVYFGSGDEYSFVGPAEILFASGEPQALKGTRARRRSNPLATVGKGVPGIKPGGVAQAGHVLRTADTKGRIRLLTPAGTRVLASTPEFQWQALQPGLPYRFELSDNTGRLVHEAEITTASMRLPPGVALREGIVYGWKVSSRLSGGEEAAASAEFSIATAAQRVEVETFRPAAGATVSERVLYATWLEQMEFRDDARRYWRALVRERPDDGNLAAHAAD